MGKANKIQKQFEVDGDEFEARYLFSMGGDMILACANETKFYILKLE